MRVTNHRKAPPRRSAARRLPSEEAILRASLDQLEHFVEVLALRTEQAQGRAAAARKGSKAEARALFRTQEARADLQAGRRLQDAVRAAEAIAAAQIALVEKDAYEAIRAAFLQFATDRAWRRASGRTAAQAGQRAVSQRTMHDLARMAADAKCAVAHVIADRNRLAGCLAEARALAAEYRRAAEAQETLERERSSLLERAATCDVDAAYFHEQLLAQERVTQELIGQLRTLFAKLPEEVAKAASARASRSCRDEVN